MSYIETFPVQHSTIIRIYSEREEIQLDPDYQRMGGVWTPEKKKLLIDSILNDYDIPKIYFHAFSREQRKTTGYSYAVIDGRQRLEAIWQFIEGKFGLADDFVYQNDESINLARLGYSDIAANYPKIKIKFDSFVLPVVGVSTDDQELIEDMFSRLNEAVPLNAAEKRNAIGGELVAAIRSLSCHDFFKNKVAFGNRRYQHQEAAARLLLVEEASRVMGKLIDTKKEYLDALARNYRSEKSAFVADIYGATVDVLNLMSRVFIERDELLRAQGNTVVYYLLFKSALLNGEEEKITRQALFSFRDLVRENRIRAEDNYAEARFELLEYDRLSQQGTNDASNIRERLRVLADFIGIGQIAA
ncbi:DUF262 domain-containing protein [Methyloversatilis discipulorum]|uniref:DUF262 domain-containing protein n=1 Tax=Methyloversatilis discipulorum TaxID=1119528 RepID=UPI0009DC4710|nr:DUF262 domain-containing protein [Methyloversatilis discipulorum]